MNTRDHPLYIYYQKRSKGNSFYCSSTFHSHRSRLFMNEYNLYSKNVCETVLSLLLVDKLHILAYLMHLVLFSMTKRFSSKWIIWTQNKTTVYKHKCRTKRKSNNSNSKPKMNLEIIQGHRYYRKSWRRLHSLHIKTLDVTKLM